MNKGVTEQDIGLPRNCEERGVMRFEIVRHAIPFFLKQSKRLTSDW